MKTFETINPAFNRVFQLGRLSLGLVVPIENHGAHPVPSLHRHLERVQLAEQLGFAAVWIRDVPFHVPTFGDAGQTFDPFTYLGYLAGMTSEIALGVASIALPLHHPVHVAKSAATIDQLSGGRLLLGVASGDRPIEYPAMGIDFEGRGELFREAFGYIRAAQSDFPRYAGEGYGTLNGQIDVLPKAFGHKLPLLVTGHSRQSMPWIAEHADGWMYYPRNLDLQEYQIGQFRELIPEGQSFSKPFMQPLYVDLQEDDAFLPQPIHLGFKIGAQHLVTYLQRLQLIGVNHLALNLRFQSGDLELALDRLATQVLPHFSIRVDEQHPI